jgi:hypothetical protein
MVGLWHGGVGRPALHERAIARAFARFAASELPQRLHATLIESTQEDRLVGHISRDSTEIEAREKPQSAPLEAAPVKPKCKRGRPRKGEQPAPPELTRLERQTKMKLAEMLDELPKAANVGTKKNSKGYKETWVGYKLHIDAADGQIRSVAFLRRRLCTTGRQRFRWPR